MCVLRTVLGVKEKAWMLAFESEYADVVTKLLTIPNSEIQAEKLRKQLNF